MADTNHFPLAENEYGLTLEVRHGASVFGVDMRVSRDDLANTDILFRQWLTPAISRLNMALDEAANGKS